MAELIEMPFGLRTLMGPGNHVLDGAPGTPIRRAILGERMKKYGDFLPWAVQERPNRSICCLDCELRWAEGSTSSIIFARWRQFAHMGRHIGTTWRIQLNRASAAAMRSYVKLLWPLVFCIHKPLNSKIVSTRLSSWSWCQPNITLWALSCTVSSGKGHDCPLSWLFCATVLTHRNKNKRLFLMLALQYCAAVK